MKRMRFTLVVITCFLLVGMFVHIALARLAILPNYETMVEDAKLVLIGTPISRVELDDLTTIPGVRRGNDSILAVAIHTTFSPVTILKGSLPKGEKTFVLYHLKENKPQDIQINAPMLIDFIPNDGSQYLMFLRRRSDDTYEAVNGQVDPAWCIEKLKHKLPGKIATSANKGVERTR
jgi:hypothetical protein